MKISAGALFLFFVAIGYITPCVSDATPTVLFDTDTEVEDEEPPKLTHEVIKWINFSDETVKLYYFDQDRGSRNQFQPSGNIPPYKVTTTNTYSGHIFAYPWGIGGRELMYQAEQTNAKFIDEEEEKKNRAAGILDYDYVEPQIHILSDFDRANEVNRRELLRAVREGELRKLVDTKTVVCGTTEGDIHIKVKPKWSPMGAAHFLDMITTEDYFTGCALNRVVPNFLTQFGICPNHHLKTLYRELTIKDDVQRDPKIPFEQGYMSFAGSGKDSRSSEVFIVMPGTPQSQLDNFGTNPWETPFGYVDPESFDVLTKWHNSYGDIPPYGNGPDPNMIYEENGYEYLQNEFPKLSYVKGCVIVPDAHTDLNGNPTVNHSYEKLLSLYRKKDRHDEDEL